MGLLSRFASFSSASKDVDAPVGDDSDFVIKVVSTVMDFGCVDQSVSTHLATIIDRICLHLNEIASCTHRNRCNELAATALSPPNHC